MHEGQVFDDDAVELDRPLDIEGYNGVEYPEPQPVVAAASGVTGPGSAWPRRPRPHVVAYGTTTHPIIPEVALMAAVAPNLPAYLTSARRIGLVGAYDGGAVGIGRVVVDSTWHHWFTWNLHGFRDSDPTIYQGMQAYYRNVGLWLTTPAQRRSMLVAAAWGVVAADPMAFPASGRGYWSVGERVMAVMSRTASQPAIADLVGAFFPIVEELSTLADDVQAEPSSSALPWDITLRAIVGGIATALLRPASEYHAAEGERRRLLDPAAIARHAADGARQGYAALTETLEATATSATDLATRLKDGPGPVAPELIPIDVDLANLRIVAERLQLTDLGDRAGDGHLTLTARLTAGGTVVANRVIEDVDVSELEKRRGFVDLDLVLFEGMIQSGELLLMQVLSGAIAPHDPAVAQVRCTETSVAAPSAWIGAHPPSPSQVWRLWYRVERVDDSTR